MKRIIIATVIAAIAVPTLAIITSSEAEARSRSSSSRSYSRPKAPQRVYTKKITVVQKNTTVINRGGSNSSGGGGMGFMQTAAAAGVGVVGANLLTDALQKDPEPTQAVAPVAAPAPVQAAPVCPTGYACDFANGVILKLPQ